MSAVITNVMQQMNCHAIATVNSFTQNANGLSTVNASMNYSKTYWQQQADGSYTPTLVNYPTLVDCPVIILGGGSTALTFPIQAGDQCLILFNDRDLNNWFAGARSGPVASARMHSFSDGIALIGFQTVSAYSSTHALLTNGNAQIGIGASNGLVRIANQTTTLGTILVQLVTVLETLTSAMSAATPSNVTATVGVPSATAASALTPLITDLDSLLE
jgi:hypothetical protein